MCSPGGSHSRGFPVQLSLKRNIFEPFDYIIAPLTHCGHICIWYTRYVGQIIVPHIVCIWGNNWCYVSFGDITAQRDRQPQFILHLQRDIVDPAVCCQLKWHNDCPTKKTARHFQMHFRKQIMIKMSHMFVSLLVRIYLTINKHYLASGNGMALKRRRDKPVPDPTLSIFYDITKP